jgi:hypothetical protein
VHKVLNPLRCCHVSSFVQFLYTCQHLNGSSTPVHWTQAVQMSEVVWLCGHVHLRTCNYLEIIFIVGLSFDS